LSKIIVTFADELFAAVGLPVLEDQHGQVGVYATDAGEIAVTMIVSDPETRQLWEAELPVAVNRLDFLIEASRLVIGGQLFLPTKGHTISIVTEDYEEVYEVLAPGSDMDCYERVNVSGTWLRVHGKLISRSAV